MPSDKYKNKYRIESTRLKHWDYAEDGCYFITICAKDREFYFGDIIGGKMKLSSIGKIANQYWRVISKHFSFVNLDEFIVMPNHIHGIIIIDKTASVGASAVSVETRHGASLPPRRRKFGPMQKNSLSSIINHYKGAVKKWCNKNNMDFLWQERFYDHIVRDEKSLNRIRQYIIDNPAKWESDRNNPENLLM